MTCPRCDSARIEPWGASIRCAICGMSYDPNQDSATQSQQQSVPIPLLEDSQPFAFERAAA